MSYKKQPMQKRDLVVALCDPGVFVREHLHGNETPIADISDGTGLAYATVRNFMTGRRPGLSVVALAPLLQFVLWQRGEIPKPCVSVRESG